MKRLIATVLAVMAFATASAQSVQVAPDLVMTGNSSAFNDGVWLRVGGQVGHANCYYAPQNVSLFYAKPNGVVDPKKVLTMLLSAKLTNRLVGIEYASDGVQADFWGYGISRCEIQRLAMY